jgi:hypothetical protein
MAAVIGAHEQLGQRELDWTSSTIRSASSGLSTQTRMVSRALGARSPQHIQTGAVAVIDLEAELAGGLDHLDIVVDDGDVHVARQQRLGDDLGEAAEADDQDALAQTLGLVDTLQRQDVPGHEPVGQQHPHRGQRHRQDDDGGQDGGGAGVEQAGGQGRSHTGRRRTRRPRPSGPRA